MKVALVAIGTEITSGQIPNDHATFLGRELTHIGYEVTHHVALPDEKGIAISTLAFLESRVQIVVITGGLGPTSDDMTREIVAEWLSIPLEFDPASWSHIVEVLDKKGKVAREIQRKQALFPRGSQILVNARGTANAFICAEPGLKVVVLPGPTPELDGLWHGEVEQLFRKWLPEKKTFLFTWLCEGRGESEYAEITESVFQETGLRIGYRLLSPRVEIKVWVAREELEIQRPRIDALTNRLKNWLIEKSGPL